MAVLSAVLERHPALAGDKLQSYRTERDRAICDSRHHAGPRAYTLGAAGLPDSDAFSAHACPVIRLANKHPAARAMVRVVRRLQISRRMLILYDACRVPFG